MADDITKKTKGKIWRRRLRTLVQVLVLLFGLVLVAWPVATDWYAAYKAQHTISTMYSLYDPLDNPERLLTLDQARRFNDKLAGKPGDYDDLWEYNDQMVYKGVQEIAWINIPKINVKLPVYHGTSEEILMVGVGHLENTSLPVGGESSHCVLTAHSGMQNERMFDQIRDLEVGDYFVVHSLGEPYAYRVYDIETILPEEVDSIRISDGRDLCTLVTCTPYGINSHRLLVHAERCEYDPSMEPSDPPIQAYVNDRTSLLLVAVLILLALLVFVIIGAIRSRDTKKKRAKMDELRQQLLSDGVDALEAGEVESSEGDRAELGKSESDDADVATSEQAETGN